MASIWHKWLHILYQGKGQWGQCQNSEVRVDEQDNIGQKMLIIGTLNKFEKSIMECLYKFLYSNVNG
jgi:hypothetical protein